MKYTKSSTELDEMIAAFKANRPDVERVELPPRANDAPAVLKGDDEETMHGKMMARYRGDHVRAQVVRGGFTLKRV